jgi:amino acid transporter
VAISVHHSFTARLSRRTTKAHNSYENRPKPHKKAHTPHMLTIFGFIAVTIMMLSYTLESRSKWYVLIFAAASAATALYSALAGVYPITVVEAIWALIALRRFTTRHSAEQLKLSQ